MEQDAPNPRVLYAEDDIMLSEIIADSLEDAGFSVSLAADGREALDTAAERPFDVLLTDLDMPRIGGLALVAALRKKRPDLPVVVLSGNPPEGGYDAFAGMGDGPLVLLTKPVRLEVVAAALRRAFPFSAPSGGTCAAVA